MRTHRGAAVRLPRVLLACAGLVALLAGVRPVAPAGAGAPAAEAIASAPVAAQLHTVHAVPAPAGTAVRASHAGGEPPVGARPRHVPVALRACAPVSTSRPRPLAPSTLEHLGPLAYARAGLLSAPAIAPPLV